jgi:uncharacterized protein
VTRIVLDPNILVSGLLSPHGAPAGILDLVVNGKVTLILDSRIFSEYYEVLCRKKFSFPEDAVHSLMEYIRQDGIFISPVPLRIQVPDPGDLPFIEVACHAGVPIVTGNIRHFRDSGAQVMTPVEFLSRVPSP